MFTSKKREWINDSFAIFTYGSWKEWIYHRPYEYLWKTHRPLFWNIRDTADGYDMQIFFLIPNGKLEFNCAVLHVKSEDEDSIRAWLDERGL